MRIASRDDAFTIRPYKFDSVLLAGFLGVSVSRSECHRVMFMQPHVTGW